MTSKTDESVDGVFVQFPLPDERLFRNRATEDILLLCVRNPYQEFTVTELREITGHGGDTVETALRVLEAAGLVGSRREGRRRLISANRGRIHNPDDPLLSIPQEEFRDPVKAFLDGIEEVDVDVVGVVLFGSVARGEADRASDVDLQVIVDDDLPAARRKLHELRRDVEDRQFDGQRYELQLLVESVESAESYGEELREIFREGITLYETGKLDEIRGAVFRGE